MVVDAVCVGPDREQHLFAAGQRYVAVALLAMAGHVNRVVRGRKPAGRLALWVLFWLGWAIVFRVDFYD